MLSHSKYAVNCNFRLKISDIFRQTATKSVYHEQVTNNKYRTIVSENINAHGCRINFPMNETNPLNFQT
jgi:hypothetical protein